MRLASQKLRTELAAQATKPSSQPPCPVCSGPLIQLRSAMRCSRCSFTICEGCAGEPCDNFAGPDD